MSNHDNLTPETEVYQPPEAMAAVFGEDVTEPGYVYTEQAGPPGPRSSAVRIQQGRDQARARAEAARVREELDRAAALEGDAEAYRRAVDDRLAGREPHPDDAAAAVRHAKAAGILQPRSSARIIADRAQGRTGPQPVTTAPAPAPRRKPTVSPEMHRKLQTTKSSRS